MSYLLFTKKKGKTCRRQDSRCFELWACGRWALVLVFLSSGGGFSGCRFAFDLGCKIQVAVFRKSRNNDISILHAQTFNSALSSLCFFEKPDMCCDGDKTMSYRRHAVVIAISRMVSYHFSKLVLVVVRVTLSIFLYGGGETCRHML